MWQFDESLDDMDHSHPPSQRDTAQFENRLSANYRLLSPAEQWEELNQHRVALRAELQEQDMCSAKGEPKALSPGPPRGVPTLVDPGHVRPIAASLCQTARQQGELPRLTLEQRESLRSPVPRLVNTTYVPRVIEEAREPSQERPLSPIRHLQPTIHDGPNATPPKMGAPPKAKAALGVATTATQLTFAKSTNVTASTNEIDMTTYLS